MPDRHKMAEAHEKHVAQVLGGTKSRGSGSQWHDKGDGHTPHFEGPFEWFWDCKATAGQSVSVTRSMLEKLDEEAHSGRPLLPIVFYDSDRLDVSPLGYRYVIREDDLLELRDAATGELREQPPGEPPPDGTVEALRQAVEDYRKQEVKYRQENARLRDENSQLRMETSGIEGMREEIAHLRKQLESPPSAPEQPSPLVAGFASPVPKLPWTVIHEYDLPTGLRRGHSAVHYDADGNISMVQVETVRVEPTSSTEVRIVLNDRVVRGGDLYVNGVLKHRTGA